MEILLAQSRVVASSEAQGAKRYPKGTAIRIELKGPKDIDVVKKLAVIELEN